MTPTHTRSVEVPNRMPHKSYEDIFCQQGKKALHNGDSE